MPFNGEDVCTMKLANSIILSIIIRRFCLGEYHCHQSHEDMSISEITAVTQSKKED